MSSIKTINPIADTNSTLKRNLMKQEEIDLKRKDNSLNGVHAISICINSVDEPHSGEKMGLDLVNEIDNSSEMISLNEDMTKVKIDDDIKVPIKNSSLPHLNENCDSKDKKRPKHLVRCEALRESSLSPPPTSNTDIDQVNSKLSFNTNHLTVYTNNNNNKTVSNSKVSLNKNNSISNSVSTSPTLSRDSSAENNLDLPIAELQSFLIETLKKCSKDRIYLLRIENELILLMKDSTKESYKFTSTSSYNRMLIHKVAAYFGLEHNVDHTHTSIIVTKTKNCRIPDVRFKELIKDDPSIQEPKKCILKRDSTSLEDSSSSSFDKDKSPDSHLNGSLSDSSRSRSLEEREEHYEKVRARIFSEDSRTSSNEAKNDSETNSNINETKLIDNKSSPQNESQKECDKVEGCVPTPILTIKTENTHEEKKKAHNSNLSENIQSSKTKKFVNNKSKQPRSDHPNFKSSNNFQRFYNPKNFDSKYNFKPNENEWNNKKTQINKHTSQNIPCNLVYPNNGIDTLYLPHFTPQMSTNMQNPANFPLDSNSYLHPQQVMQHEQLYQQQLICMNPSIMPLLNNPAIANVPNSMINQLNYNSNGVNSFASNNLPLPNNYSYMCNNVQPTYGSNGVPYAPASSTNANLATPQHFNSFVGMPYQQQQLTQSTPMNVNMMPNLTRSFKNPNERDSKVGIKNLGYCKNSVPLNSLRPMNHPLNFTLTPGHSLYPCPNEMMDRSIAPVQIPNSFQLTPNDFSINRALLQSPQVPNYLNYSNIKRHPNEVLIQNPAPPLPQSILAINNQNQKMYGHQMNGQQMKNSGKYQINNNRNNVNNNINNNNKRNEKNVNMTNTTVGGNMHNKNRY